MGKFEGTSSYIATEDLKTAVNAAITLERPLLVKGEPGTGKTVLAIEIARALGKPLISAKPVSPIPAAVLGAALVLGALFIVFALRLRRDQSERAAMALFRYSITYLTLLFVAMAGDVLIRFH